LPDERNGVEAVPVPLAQSAVIAAVKAQAWGQASGTLERRLTDTETSVTDTALLTFTTAGNESTFIANATWGEFEVDISANDDGWWIVTNAAYAEQLGADDWAQGRCVASNDPLARQWSWLSGPGAVLESVTVNLAWGSAPSEIEAGGAVFPLAESGAVVGSIRVAALGTPLPERIELDDLSGSGEVLFDTWSDEPLVEVQACGPESTS
jgi:hypothetical protein